MSDDRLRKLERLAATGDADAMRRLVHARLRAGQALPAMPSLEQFSKEPVGRHSTLFHTDDAVAVKTARALAATAPDPGPPKLEFSDDPDSDTEETLPFRVRDAFARALGVDAARAALTSASSTATQVVAALCLWRLGEAAEAEDRLADLPSAVEDDERRVAILETIRLSCRPADERMRTRSPMSRSSARPRSGSWSSTAATRAPSCSPSSKTLSWQAWPPSA